MRVGSALVSVAELLSAPSAVVLYRIKDACVVCNAGDENEERK